MTAKLTLPRTKMSEYNVTEYDKQTSERLTPLPILQADATNQKIVDEIITKRSTIQLYDISPKAVILLELFPVGTIIESADGTDGGSEVFIGDGGYLQPFSYLGDYDPTHYIIKEII